MRKHALKDLIEQEKLLYLEVEQLRYRLYLQDNSVIFGFFSAFYFAYHDIKKIFIKKRVEGPSKDMKLRSIVSLKKKKESLNILSYTPYAWIIFLARKIKYSLSFRLPAVVLTKAGAKSRDPNGTFLIFGSTSGDDLQSRSVQITEKLSEKNKVIYVEGVFDEGSTSGFRVISEAKNKTVIRLTARKSLHLNYQKPTTKETTFLKKSFSRFNVATSTRSNVTFYIHHPFWGNIISPKKSALIFDRSDNFEKINNAHQYIINLEKILMKHASMVSAPNKKLLRNKKDILIKNGVDWEYFKDTSKMIQTCDVGLCWIKKPVMGYIGTLDEKIDEQLLAKLAETFPTASLVLVGNTDYRPVIEVAEKYLNIFPVGKQPYSKLPLFLQSFDILISPLNLLTAVLPIIQNFPFI